MLRDKQIRVRGAIALLGAVLTLFLVYAATALVPPHYQTSASLLLLPGEKVIPEGGNPFLFLGGVTPARDVLLTITNSEAVSAKLRGGDADVSYVATSGASTGAPLIQVTVNGPEQSSVNALRDAVLAEVPRELNSIQDEADTPSLSRISSMVLVSEETPMRVLKSEIRAAVVGGVAGLALTFAALAAASAVTRRRAGRRPPRGQLRRGRARGDDGRGEKRRGRDAREAPGSPEAAHP